MSRTSSAYEAGIRPGDIIVSFNGQRVDDPSQFVRLLADAPIGSTVKLGIIREGKRIDVPVEVVVQSRTRSR
jgi:S1-C subfamily serine protease